MFSVVIPTMQRSDYLSRLLAVYFAHDRVGQVVVINNTDQGFPYSHPKLQVISLGENIFVNPAWNLGAKSAQHDRLIISNDDILFAPDLLDDCHRLTTRKVGIIGPDKSCFDGGGGETRLQYITRRPWGWGTLMMMRTRHYVPIPDGIRIASGDSWLHGHQRQPNYALIGPAIETKMGTTSRDPRFFDQQAADAKLAGELMPVRPYDLAMARRDDALARRREWARRFRIRSGSDQVS